MIEQAIQRIVPWSGRRRLNGPNMELRPRGTKSGVMCPPVRQASACVTVSHAWPLLWDCSSVSRASSSTGNQAPQARHGKKQGDDEDANNEALDAAGCC